MRRACLFVALGFCLFPAGIGRADDSTASKRVRSILARCVACHNPDDESGDLDLTTRESALRGGESGPALLPGKPDESPLYKLVAKRKMPPKTPLSADEMAVVRDWIAEGAPWTGTITAASEAADSPRWAFRPVERPSPPMVKDRDWARTPIDAFLLAELEARGLRPRPPAERRVWIRRVTLDLTGLPPTPEEVDNFERDDCPDADARLVDRLLASPHYGERWGRHWLDLARFGESHGFEYDRLRDHAWPYRDYVIKSLNDDKPYATFVKEQIAGDVMQPVSGDGIAATGFLVAGPWDQVGSGQANLVSRMRVREEELEDIVGVVSQTFLGVTVQCARCHNHKFDPIPQSDYYRIKAAFEGVGRDDRPTLSEPERLAREVRRRLLAGSISTLETELAAIDRAARARVGKIRATGVDGGRPEPRLLWTFESDATEENGTLPSSLMGAAVVAHGRLILSEKGAYLRSGPLPFEIREKTLEAWVSLADHAQRGGGVISVERGKGAPFDAIVFGEARPGKWMAGSENFLRTGELAAPVETSKPGELIHIAIAYDPDGSIRIYRQGAAYGKPYRPEGTGAGLQAYGPDVSHLNLGLRHTGASNGFLAGEIEEARIYDRALKADEVEKSFRAGPIKITEGELDAESDEASRLRRRELRGRLSVLRSELAEVAKIPRVYSVAPFQPPPTKILARGDVETPGAPVSAGGLSSVDRPSGDFGLSVDAPEARRRLLLAEWIADPSNPLTARVMVNRVWHYHFGAGLVATPSDFGANGGRPSHPALLDWLASDFLRGGGRLKSLHRTIVLSNAYRQASTFDARASAVDADCRLLWRFPPRRLEGEAVLDAMLATTGRLNSAIGGPSFRPFTVTVFNSNFYNLTDPDEPEYRRRTVYRMDVHSAKSPLMDGLDCPDPSTKTPKRSLTVTPLQALALMNDSFVERQARRLADRARTDAGEDPGLQVDRAYRLALGRAPRADEARAALGLVRDHGLHRLTWALLNANEFLYLR